MNVNPGVDLSHNTASGLAKSYGERLRGCNVRNMDPEKAEGLSPELQRALERLPAAIAELSERICEYNQRIEAFQEEKRQRPKCRVPVTALIAWPTFHS